MKEYIKKLLREYAEYYEPPGSNYSITRVVRDDRHTYHRVDGITYELSGSGREHIVHVDEIEETQENTFYEDQIQRYVDYLENDEDPIIHTFDVVEHQLGGAYTLRKMLLYLEEQDSYDLLFDLVHVHNSNAHTPLYKAISDLAYGDKDDIEHGMELKILDNIKSIEDLDLYYGKDYLDDFDEEEIEDYGYFWEPEYYEGFKKILEHWSDNKEYSLRNMNHRFRAVKQLGVKRVYVDVRE